VAVPHRCPATLRALPLRCREIWTALPHRCYPSDSFGAWRTFPRSRRCATSALPPRQSRRQDLADSYRS
jgi:hypothetical protein